MMESLAFERLVQHIRQFQHTIPSHVRIVAVTKQVSPEAMRAAYAAGIRDFGENRLQDALPKQQELADLADVTWHFIGHLQSNKVQKVLEQFAWIHSVDSLKLAERLDRLAEGLAQPPNLCLQVKLLPDPNKAGWEVDQLLRDLPALDRLRHVRIQGLMVIPPLGLSEVQLGQFFEQTRELAARIQQQSWSHLAMGQLSMGMSEDYPLAIAAGATMIRPGRVLFGSRSPFAPAPKDSSSASNPSSIE